MSNETERNGAILGFLVSSLVFGIPILIVAVPAAIVWHILKHPKRQS